MICCTKIPLTNGRLSDIIYLNQNFLKSTKRNPSCKKQLSESSRQGLWSGSVCGKEGDRSPRPLNLRRQTSVTRSCWGVFLRYSSGKRENGWNHGNISSRGVCFGAFFILRKYHLWISLAIFTQGFRGLRFSEEFWSLKPWAGLWKCSRSRLPPL